jgi:hypothetical protein
MKRYAIRMYGGVYVWIDIFLTLALFGGEWSVSHPCRFNPGEISPRYPLDRRLGGPEAGLDDMEVKILDPTGIRIATPLSTSP